MNNLRMSVQGTGYTEDAITLSWGFGPTAVRDVIYVPPIDRPGRLRARIGAGFIEETNEPITALAPVGYVAPPPPPQELVVRLSAAAGDGDGIVYNADTGLFDPAPRAANISSISLPDNATAADIAAAFNDLRVVLIEANVMEPDPT